MFVRNAWYAAAWDHEVKRRLLARTIAGEPIVLYRRTDGSPAALADACWHRLVPLSLGRLEGDEVECGYHGLRFGPEGRCTRMPSQHTLHPGACVRAYPVVERHRFVWVWLGNPAAADPALIPDMHWNDDPAWAGDGELLRVACDYRLVIDNLMDLTHETFVHAGSIGNRAVAEAPFESEDGDDTATVTRWMIDVEPPPFWRAQLGKPGRVDRWQIIRFLPPCTVLIDVGVAPHGSGAPEGDRSQGVNGYVLNTITPETERSCLYFWSFCRNYRLSEQRLTTELRQGVAGIFAEDERILEAQQRAIERLAGRPLVNLNIDAGGLRARRLIERMLARERAAPQLVAE
jgi:vanillate O-demethylase monooxygenase subunit